MRSLARSIAARAGLAATHELYADGFDRYDLSAAVCERRIIRARQGWYVLPDVHPAALAAGRVGGRLSCVSALRLMGAWTLPDARHHVAVEPHASRLRAAHDKRQRLSIRPAGVVVHWRHHHAPGRLVMPASHALVDMIACAPTELAIATADSALRQGLVSRQRWRSILTTSAHRGELTHVDGICESGTESIWWTRMRRLHLPITRQVPIRGVGRVDFLVGSRLVVEVDGAAYHTDPTQFESDRRRDAVLSALGYRVLRFSYRQVVSAWDEVERAVLAAISRGDHLPS